MACPTGSRVRDGPDNLPDLPPPGRVGAARECVPCEINRPDRCAPDLGGPDSEAGDQDPPRRRGRAAIVIRQCSRQFGPARSFTARRAAPPGHSSWSKGRAMIVVLSAQEAPGRLDCMETQPGRIGCQRADLRVTGQRAAVSRGPRKGVGGRHTYTTLLSRGTSGHAAG